MPLRRCLAGLNSFLREPALRWCQSDRPAIPCSVPPPTGMSPARPSVAERIGTFDRRGRRQQLHAGPCSTITNAHAFHWTTDLPDLRSADHVDGAPQPNRGFHAAADRAQLRRRACRRAAAGLPAGAAAVVRHAGPEAPAQFRRRPLRRDLARDVRQRRLGHDPLQRAQVFREAALPHVDDGARLWRLRRGRLAGAAVRGAVRHGRAARFRAGRGALVRRPRRRADGAGSRRRADVERGLALQLARHDAVRRDGLRAGVHAAGPAPGRHPGRAPPIGCGRAGWQWAWRS